MACQTSLTALVWWWCVCSPPSWEKECGDMKRHNYSLLQVELCWETQSLLQRRSSNVAQSAVRESQKPSSFKGKDKRFFHVFMRWPHSMNDGKRQKGRIDRIVFFTKVFRFIITFNQHNYSNNVTEEMYWTPGPTQICYALWKRQIFSRRSKHSQGSYHGNTCSQYIKFLDVIFHTTSSIRFSMLSESRSVGPHGQSGKIPHTEIWKRGGRNADWKDVFKSTLCSVLPLPRCPPSEWVLRWCAQLLLSTKYVKETAKVLG